MHTKNLARLLVPMALAITTLPNAAAATLSSFSFDTNWSQNQRPPSHAPPVCVY